MAENVLNVKREGEFTYPILFENDFEKLAESVKKEGLDGRNVCIVADSNTAPLYAEKVKNVLATVCPNVFLFTFPAGEASKNLDTVQELYETLIVNKIDRKGFLAALGGGVTGDLTGSARPHISGGSTLYRFPRRCLPRWTAAWEEKRALISASTRIWWALFISPALYT